MILIDRKAAGLKPPRKRLGAAHRARKGVVIHCAGSGPAVTEPSCYDEAAKLWRNVQRWHFARGWATVGYHRAVWGPYVFEGRPLDRIGAHAGPGRWPASKKDRGSFNGSHFGVLVLGDGVTVRPETLETLAGVIAELAPGKAEIVPHFSLSAKECPGRGVRAWLRQRYPGRDPYASRAG